MQQGAADPTYFGTAGAGFRARRRRAVPVLVAMNLIMFVFLVGSTLGTGEARLKEFPLLSLFTLGASYPPAIIRNAQFWRLVTAGFLHAGLQPLLVNIALLSDIGADAEGEFGASRLAVLYFAATVVGFSASALFGMQISLGLSPGLFGLIGALISYGAWQRSSIGKMTMLKYSQFAFFTLLLSLLPTANIDTTANFAGLLCGFSLAFVTRTPGHRRIPEFFWLCAAVACAAMTVVSFGEMAIAATESGLR